jgi:hypothetical protein
MRLRLTGPSATICVVRVRNGARSTQFKPPEARRDDLNRDLNDLPQCENLFGEDAMQASKWPNRTETAEARVNRIGTCISLVVLFAALVLTGIWIISTPTFEKCIALAIQSERAVCFESLREGLVKSPAKGGSPPSMND